jgi:hypothetical protein
METFLWLYREWENPKNGDLPLVVVVSFKYYRGPIWDTQYPTHVPIFPTHKMCGPSCCTRKQIPLHAWANTINYVQGHSAVPSAANQTLNAIQIIIIHHGDRTYEALNLGLTYVTISRETTIICLGHMPTMPNRVYEESKIFLRRDQ